MAVASVFLVHGVARLSFGTVDDFGAFLSSARIPLGHVLAWVLTAVEIAGGPVLATGLVARPLVAWFGVELVMGIVLVHARAGWFVVGAGRNGVEYSVLIIACLVVVALTDSASYRLRGPST